MGFEFKNQKDQHIFEIFAFGKTHARYDMACMHAWNSLHGDKLWLSSSERIQDSIKKMYAIFLESLETQ